MMKRMTKLLNVVLTLALLLTLVPTTVFAEELTPITGVSLSGLAVPVVGEYIQYVDGSDLVENPSGSSKYEVIDNQTCTWKDEDGRYINYGAQVFEAGRTYSISFNVKPKDGYAFTSEDIPVELYNLYPHQYMGSIELSQESKIASVTFTFALGGERTYADITTFRFYGMRAPTDGDTVSISNGEWAYNNSEVTDRYWTDEAGNRVAFGTKFVGGSSYFYNYEFTAFDGYKFAENLSVRADNEVPTNWEYIFNDARTTLHIKIPYYIGTSDTVSSIVVDGMFVPNQTKSTRDWDSNVYLRVPNDSNYTIPLQTKSWYEVDAEYSVDTEYKVTEPVFRAGKQYKMFLIVHAKDGYKFASPEAVSFTFAGIPASTYTYTCSDGGAEDIMEVIITFTAQFPDGAGESASNPAWCYSYIELKTALESSHIRYVALGNVEDMLPYVPHDPTVDDNRGTAIVVRGKKDLNLLGSATFTCPIVVNYDYKTYEELITVSDYANSDLYIHGTGSLTFEGGNEIFYNSAIRVQGGSLAVDGATIVGSHGTHTGYCYGINALYGGVSILGGATIRGSVYEGHGVYALSVGSEGITRSLSVSIWDGKFYVDRGVEGGYTSGGEYIPYVDYGISVQTDVGLRIYGMTTDGIELSRNAADTLDKYVVDGCAMTVDGVPTDPASCSTTDKYVEVFQEITKVDVHVNSPVEGGIPAMYPEDVYLLPEGVTVQDLVWYENGQIWYMNGGNRFEAGNTYKLELTLVADPGVKFANHLTSATINYKTAQVVAHAGNWSSGIVMTVDFGECSAVIHQVDLTVTAPKEGSKPSYTIGCGSDAYYAVGGSNNYTEYRKWYMSSDGYDWWEINETHAFMSGYYYKFVVDIRTMNGYEFPLVDNGSSIVPNVSATVNGYTAKVIKAYDQDPSRYITVEYNFGECSDSVVENIVVENVTAPVAGEKPNYNWSIRGTGYQMNTGKNNENYGVRNGMQWMTGDWDYVFPNDTFVPGKTYICRLNLVADNGFTFAQDKDYRPTVTATVNGEAAVIEEDFTKLSEARIYYTFTCTQPTIDTVMLYNLDAPAAGEVPDTEVTAAYPELYEVTNVRWLDEEGGVVNSFVQGRLYTAEITVAAKKYDGVDGCIFANEVTAYIDGTEVTGWSNKVTNNGDGTVTIYYQFRKPAQAPTVQYFFFVDQPTDGQVYAGESWHTGWSTTFVAQRYDIEYWCDGMWTLCDTVQTGSDEAQYDFTSTKGGATTFRIVAYHNGMARAVSNQFTITWIEPVTLSWSGDKCTVTLEKSVPNVLIIAAAYEGGKMVSSRVVTSTLTLTGDSVKVFFLTPGSFQPLRDPISE